MEFSIIIPTYMEEGYIEKCLKSALGQKYDRKEFEIIVSDARSADGTAGIARRYADKVIVEDRKGIAFGRNIGARNAAGEILVFIDADAEIERDFLYFCHEIFLNKGIVGVTGIAKPGDGGVFQRFVYRATYYLVRFFNFIGLSLFPGICAAYRKEEFLMAGGFREDFGIVEDLDLSRRISRIGKCAVAKKACVFVSTRRLDKNLFPTVMFHIYCDIRYLLTGRAPAVYPKTEELRTWRELWTHVR
ncbi:MAG: glycosyltransferase [Bacteroidetes bacterium]|nr:glycosyltransferase [Bacteroidota bacterium]